MRVAPGIKEKRVTGGKVIGLVAVTIADLAVEHVDHFDPFMLKGLERVGF